MDIKKQTKIVIGTKEYIISFPNAGQLMDIESLKQVYTNNTYSVLATSVMKSSEFALDLADMIATFSTLIPQLRKDFEIESWGKLEASQAKLFIKIYKEQYYKWFKPLIDELYNMGEEPINKEEKE